jgi:hypothetical protein
MKTFKRIQLTEENKTKAYSVRQPLLFVIPRPFEDDYGRNSFWSAQVLKLERKSQKLKEELKKMVGTLRLKNR